MYRNVNTLIDRYEATSEIYKLIKTPMCVRTWLAELPRNEHVTPELLLYCRAKLHTLLKKF